MPEILFHIFHLSGNYALSGERIPVHNIYFYKRGLYSLRKRKGSMRFVLPGSDADAYAPPLPGLPIVEIVGDRRVLVENHNGVIDYSDSIICVRVKFGRLLIIGERLSLSYMSKSQLIITGYINSVAIERR